MHPCLAVGVFTSLLFASAAVGQNPRRSLSKTSPRAASGIAMPEKDVVLSVPVEGVLLHLDVEEGAVVKAGQVLARLDDRLARAAVAAATSVVARKAEIDHATEELVLAEKKLARLEAAGKSVSRMLVEEARTRHKQATASLKSAREAQVQAERNLDVERARLERLTIRAPFDGRVTKIFATRGATLTTAHELLRLVALETLRVDLHLPIAQYKTLRAKQAYRLRAATPVDRPLIAELLFVDPMLDAATRTVRCRFRILNPKAVHPAGFAVTFDGAVDSKVVPAGGGR